MSCNCNCFCGYRCDDRSFVSCNCCNCTTTTSTTTTTTLCPDPLPCDTVYLTDCIVYSACDDECVQVYTGDTLTQTFANIFEAYQECYGPIETTTTGAPEELVEICLSYAPTGGCAAACVGDCSTYYVYTSCYNNIVAGSWLGSLDCVIYGDNTGTVGVPAGFYSYEPSSLCLYASIYNDGVVTGVSPCP